MNQFIYLLLLGYEIDLVNNSPQPVIKEIVNIDVYIDNGVYILWLQSFPDCGPLN